MRLQEFGLGAYVLALLCVIITSFALFAFLAWPRRWLSLMWKTCIYLFNQLHCNTFLANSLEDPYALLGRLERGNSPEQDTRSWYGLSWPFGRRGREYSRRMAIENTLHRRKSADHGVVESVVASASNSNAEEPSRKVSGGKTQKKGRHKSAF
jgi:hypothetical protein